MFRIWYWEQDMNVRHMVCLLIRAPEALWGEYGICEGSGAEGHSIAVRHGDWHSRSGECRCRSTCSSELNGVELRGPCRLYELLHNTTYRARINVLAYYGTVRRKTSDCRERSGNVEVSAREEKWVLEISHVQFFLLKRYFKEKCCFERFLKFVKNIQRNISFIDIIYQTNGKSKAMQK